MTRRAIALAVLAALALVLILWLLWSFDPFGRRKAAEAKAAAATMQADVSEATTEALDTYQTRTVIIREKSNAAVQQVQRAPGANDPLPDELRRRWLDGLRANDAAAEGERSR